MRIDLSDFIASGKQETLFDTGFDAESVSFGGESLKILKKDGGNVTVRRTDDGKVIICGRLDLSLEMTCARCLKKLSYDISLSPEAVLDGGFVPEDGEELSYLSGHCLSSDEMFLDECYQAMPISVLCREDCRGLCKKCGKDLNEGSCSCDTFEPDPRMARIFDIYNSAKEEV